MLNFNRSLKKVNIQFFFFFLLLNILILFKNLLKSEPYVFIFVQDFDVKAGEPGQLMNKTDILRLKIA